DDREIDRALKVVENMRDGGMTPDVYTYMSIIGGLGLVGKFEEAKNCFLQMVEKGHKPCNVSFRRIKFKDLDEQPILICCPVLCCKEALQE
ncbi:hypothetical protein IFM89_018583, partial [Coptis chinensis]